MLVKTQIVPWIHLKCLYFSKKEVYSSHRFNNLGEMMRNLVTFLFVFPLILGTQSVFAQNNELVLEEVVVTATKKEENVQSIAETVNAVSGDTIDDYQIRNLNELSQVVSGVEFTQIDPRRSTIVIRGQKMDPDGGNDQPVQAYIDEAPVRPAAAFLQMFDTERVEILKGAQGTLQGVVSIGGAVHIYTRDAEIGSDERNGYVKTTIADNSTTILEFASDLPISDTMALRVAAVSNDNAGNEVKNIRNGDREDHDYDAFRLSLNWEPADDLSVRLKYQNMEYNTVSPRPLAGSNGPFVYDAFADVAGASNPFFPAVTLQNYAQAVSAYLGVIGAIAPGSLAQLQLLNKPSYADIPAVLDPEDGVAVHFQRPAHNNSGELLNLMIDYDMGSHMFSLRASDYEMDTAALIDRDYAGAFLWGYPQEVRTNAGITTIEARISNTDDSALEYTIGFFSRDSQTYTHADLDRSFARTEIAPGILMPIVPFEYESPFDACQAEIASPGMWATRNVVITCVGIPVDNRTEAIFADFKYNLSDKTFIQFGVREQDLSGYRQQQIYLPLTADVGVAVGGGSTFEQIPTYMQNPESDSTTGGIKLGHFVEDDVLLYITYQTGYRSPGSAITPSAIAPSLLVFDEEETAMTEFGMKGTFLDGRLRLNFAYFDYAFDGFQAKWDNVTARTYSVAGAGPTQQIMGGLFNNNDASMTGFDVEYQYIVNESLVLGGSYSQNESEFDPGAVAFANDPSYAGMLAATRDITGTPVNDAAESSWTFYLDHSVPAFAGGERYTRYNINWRDARKSSVNPDLSIEELYLANLYFGWRSGDGAWDANLFVKNVLDDVDLSHIQSYYTEYGMPGGSGLGSKFYEGLTNRGRQLGLQVTYNF